MKISEISDEDESYFNLNGIQYNFEKDYKTAVFNMSSVKKFPSPLPGNAYYNSVMPIIRKIENFIKTCKITHVPDNDPDIIRANEIYNELLKLKP